MSGFSFYKEHFVLEAYCSVPKAESGKVLVTTQPTSTLHHHPEARSTAIVQDLNDKC
jgi:hypothetical protein